MHQHNVDIHNAKTSLERMSSDECKTVIRADKKSGKKSGMHDSQREFPLHTDTKMF
jgi:hypothetical protein